MKRFLTILAVLMMIAGISLLAYPTAGSWWRDRIQANIAQTYYESTLEMCQEEIDEHFRRAREYNDFVGELSSSGILLLGERAIMPDDYEEILNVDGVMARLEIPVINLDLPILHGTYGTTMENGVGHLEGSAFPTGGYGTHSVLTTHSGMAGVTLFSELHYVMVGDYFFISVLGERLAYQVRDIYVIYPHEIESLRAVPDADIVTLITCTPFAVNTHRLLVRGYRVPYVFEVLEEVFDEILMIDRHLSAWGGMLLAAGLILAKMAHYKTRARHTHQRPADVSVV